MPLPSTQEDPRVVSIDEDVGPEELEALERLGAAQELAFKAVSSRRERWVAYHLVTGELDLGDDDHRLLTQRLIEKHGASYYTRLSVIGPRF